MKILIAFIICVVFMVIVEQKRGGEFGGSFGVGLAGLILMFLISAIQLYRP